MSAAGPSATRWVHRPTRGPVAWGVATLVVPTVPLLCLLPLVVLSAALPDSSGQLRSVLAPLPWLAVGVPMALRTTSPRARGVGLGLAAGALTTLAVALAVSGGWTP